MRCSVKGQRIGIDAAAHRSLRAGGDKGGCLTGHEARDGAFRRQSCAIVDLACVGRGHRQRGFVDGQRTFRLMDGELCGHIITAAVFYDGRSGDDIRVGARVRALALCGKALYRVALNTVNGKGKRCCKSADALLRAGISHRAALGNHRDLIRRRAVFDLQHTQIFADSVVALFGGLVKGQRVGIGAAAYKGLGSGGGEGCRFAGYEAPDGARRRQRCAVILLIRSVRGHRQRGRGDLEGLGDAAGVVALSGDGNGHRTGVGVIRGVGIGIILPLSRFQQDNTVLHFRCGRMRKAVVGLAGNIRHRNVSCIFSTAAQAFARHFQCAVHRVNIVIPIVIPGIRIVLQGIAEGIVAAAHNGLGSGDIIVLYTLAAGKAAAAHDYIGIRQRSTVVGLAVRSRGQRDRTPGNGHLYIGRISDLAAACHNAVVGAAVRHMLGRVSAAVGAGNQLAVLVPLAGAAPGRRQGDRGAVIHLAGRTADCRAHMDIIVVALRTVGAVPGIGADGSDGDPVIAGRLDVVQDVQGLVGRRLIGLLQYAIFIQLHLIRLRGHVIAEIAPVFIDRAIPRPVQLPIGSLA